MSRHARKGGLIYAKVFTEGRIQKVSAHKSQWSKTGAGTYLLSRAAWTLR